MSSRQECRAQNKAACTNPRCPARRTTQNGIANPTKRLTPLTTYETRIVKQQAAQTKTVSHALDAARELIQTVEAAQPLDVYDFMQQLTAANRGNLAVSQQAFDTLRARGEIIYDMDQGTVRGR